MTVAKWVAGVDSFPEGMTLIGHRKHSQGHQEKVSGLKSTLARLTPAEKAWKMTKKIYAGVTCVSKKNKYQ